MESYAEKPALIALQKVEVCMSELSSCWQVLHSQLSALQAEHDRLAAQRCAEVHNSHAVQSRPSVRFSDFYHIDEPLQQDQGERAASPVWGSEKSELTSSALLGVWRADDDKGAAPKLSREASFGNLSVATSGDFSVPTSPSALSVTSPRSPRNNDRPRRRRRTSMLGIDGQLVDNADNALDGIVALVIISNVIVLGVSTLNIDWPGWQWIDMSFSILYTAEMMIKLARHGCKTHFCGLHKWWNWFDAIIVLIAVIDNFFSKMHAGKYFQVLKVVRIGRLARIFRLFRYDFCREFSLMLVRLAAGMKSLQAALGLLFFTIWSLAVLLAMTMSFDPDDPRFPLDFDVQERKSLFSDTFCAGFTVYRCITGDCTTRNGDSLVMLMSEAYGALFVVPYTCTMLVVNFGILNLIMAIFVERTLQQSHTLEVGGPTTPKAEATVNVS